MCEFFGNLQALSHAVKRDGVEVVTACCDQELAELDGRSMFICVTILVAGRIALKPDSLPCLPSRHEAGHRRDQQRQPAIEGLVSIN